MGNQQENDLDRCKWLIDDVCCNARSDCCADFPDVIEYCKKCKWYEKES